MISNKRLNDWRRFVRQVEKGYAFGMCEYQNDLDIRKLIQCEIDSKRIPELLLPKALAVLDRSFVAATDDWPQMAAIYDPEAWWIRKPKTLVFELKEDVESFDRTAGPPNGL